MFANVMQRPTLVLNRNWQAVNVTSVARSVSMLFSGSARVVDPETYQLFEWEDWAELEPQPGELFIQAVSRRFCVPEIISLKDFDRLPNSAVTFSRRNIFKRDRFTCQYCGGQPKQDELTIDHVVPRAQGGQSTWENCVLACVTCNHVKADRTPEQAKMKLRKVPVRPNWNPTFSRHNIRLDSWQNFVSDAYWNVELE